MKATPQVGDVYFVRSEGGVYDFGQYLGIVLETGPQMTFWRGDSSDFENSEFLFGPIFVGILHPIKMRKWTLVGNFSLKVAPTVEFLSFHPARTGELPIWMHSVGMKITMLGTNVPIHLKELETDVIWSSELIEKRLRTGKNFFSFESMLSAAQEGRN